MNTIVCGQHQRQVRIIAFPGIEDSMKTSIEQAFGHEIRKARESSGKSQESLAFEAEIHRTYISLIERGQKSPTLGVILRLARALNLKPSELVRRAEARFEKSTP